MPLIDMIWSPMLSWPHRAAAPDGDMLANTTVGTMDPQPDSTITTPSGSPFNFGTITCERSKRFYHTVLILILYILTVSVGSIIVHYRTGFSLFILPAYIKQVQIKNSHITNICRNVALCDVLQCLVLHMLKRCVSTIWSNDRNRRQTNITYFTILSITKSKRLIYSNYLFLHFFIRKHIEFLSKYFLLIEHLLVVHLLHQTRVLDPICLQELHVGHLEGLPDRLGDEASLQ